MDELMRLLNLVSTSVAEMQPLHLSDITPLALMNERSFLWMCFCIQVTIYLTLTRPLAPGWIKPVYTERQSRLVCLKRLHSWCHSPPSPFLWPSTPACHDPCIIRHASNTPDFFFLWSSNLDSLCYSSVQSLITFQTCICVFLTYFSISLPLSPLSLLLPFSCLHVWSSWAPMDHDIIIHTNLFHCVFLFCFLSLNCYNFNSKTVVDIDVRVSLIDHLSYPRLPMCDLQSGSSSALPADSALALINWFCSRRKRLVWAAEIFGPRPLCFLCLSTLVQSHTRKKKR